MLILNLFQKYSLLPVVTCMNQKAVLNRFINESAALRPNKMIKSIAKIAYVYKESLNLLKLGDHIMRVTKLSLRYIFSYFESSLS